jgi:collagenase-like PrtC family protease
MKVKFHLPDFATHYKVNMVFTAMLKNCPQYFREGVEIASFYGVFPPSVWNGGRTQGGVCSDRFIQTVIHSFNSLGIPLRFTFTNPVLEEKHLDDEFCNKVMRMADNGLNEVIVVSPLLEQYIRTKYPNYKITSSTCKRLNNADALAEELRKDYHIVVVDYDLNNNFEELEKLPNKEKCEFLANACCDPCCGARSEHYRRIGEQQITYCEHLKNSPDKPFNMADYSDLPLSKAITCKCRERTIFDIKNLSTHISPDDIWNKYVPMGFNQFKLEGRTTGRLNLIENYMYYMIKPECVDEARFMFLHNLEANGVISIDKA